MKIKTPEQQISEYGHEIVNEIAMWKDHNKNGCNDPAWPDGCNMNLLRNHIIYYKHKIRELCTDNGITLPVEYYFPTPPEVPDNYMAHLRQAERVKRLRQWGYKLVAGNYRYDDRQMSLF